MVLSLNEIRRRAFAFVHEWKDEENERAEAQTFWNQFFEIFGINRRRVASFEKPSIALNGNTHFIDLFWKGKLVVEHKSKGKDLNKAYTQALDYFNGLEQDELPKYVIVSDFSKFKIYDLDNDTEKEIKLEELPSRLELFDFIPEHRRIDYGVFKTSKSVFSLSPTSVPSIFVFLSIRNVNLSFSNIPVSLANKQKTILTNSTSRSCPSYLLCFRESCRCPIFSAAFIFTGSSTP